MALTGSTRFSYPVDLVVQAFSSEDFQRQATTNLGGKLLSLNVEGETAAQFTQITERSAPTDRLPEMLRKLAGNLITLTQTDQYSAPEQDGSRSIETKISLKGVPVSVSASQKISPADGGSELSVNADVASSIPFIGGKISSMAQPYISRALNKQSALVNKWLEDRSQ